MRRGLALLALLALVALGACDDRPVHAFVASRYDPVRDCLEPRAAVDVIAGEDPGTCDSTRCWQSPSGEVYITTTACDGPLDYVDRSNDLEGSTCFLALSAHARTEGACP